MKKILAVLLALTVIGGLAFAQVTFSGYDRLTLTATKSSIAMANRVRLNLTAKDADGNFGVWARLQNADSAAPTMSYAYGWAFLADKKIKITAGKLGNYDYDLSSGVSEYQLGNVSNDMVILDATTGMLVQFYPVEGLDIGLSVIPSTTAINVGNFGLNLKYDIKDVGSVVVTSWLNNTIANSAASISFDYTGMKGLDLSIGGKYGSAIGYKATAAKNMTVYAIVNFDADALSLQVAPEYDITGKALYLEGAVTYTLGSFKVRGIGAYDQAGGQLDSTYFGGLEVLYTAGKTTVTTGVYYDQVKAISVPLAVKVAF